MKERWKPAKYWEDRLEVSNLGNVRTIDYLAPSRRALQAFQLRRGRPLSPHKSQSGYPVISVKTGARRVKVFVHTLVGFAFVDGHFNGATVDHIDGDKTNNCASNLEWVTKQENSRRQNRDGRGVPKGQRHPGAKLKDSDIPELFKLREAGWSLSEIGRQFAVSGSLVHKITTGIRRASS